MPKPIIPRQAASQDIDEALAYYMTEASDDVATGFIDALEAAYRHISEHPAAGSPRYAHELNLPGLRSWQLPNYPYLIFYIELAALIDVWRVLHAQREIPAWLQTPAAD
jgi:toxin ParE1/3/4